MQFPEDVEFLTPEDVAKALNMSLRTLRDLRRAKKGPEYYKLGPRNGVIRYHKNDVMYWVDSRKQEQGR